MKIVRANYKDRQGKTCKSRNWYIDFFDHLNRRHKLAGFTQKSQTEDLGRQIESLISSKLGNSTLTPVQQAWLEGLPDNLLKNLIKWGLVDGQRAESGKPLAVHLQDWKNSMLANGCTAEYADQKYKRTKAIFDKAGFLYFSGISASKLQLEISKIKRTVKVKSKGKLVDKVLSEASDTTKNFYLQGCKQFCKWAIEDQRISQNPLQHLKPNKAESQSRAALSPDELRHVLTYTETAWMSFGLTGYQRAMLYRFAAETGFRASEIRALKVSDFDFGNNTVMLSGKFTKNNKEARLPIKTATAERLKELFSGKLPLTEAFKLPYDTNMARMLRADIKAAGVKIESQRGTLDFHSLRHTFGTMLAASGVHPKTAQQLMRHGDINLTMSRYTHVLRGQESQAIDNLPDLDLLPENMQQKKTGTNDSKADAISNFVFHRSFTKNMTKQCNSLQLDAKQCRNIDNSKSVYIESKTGILSQKQALTTIRPAGVELEATTTRKQRT